MFRQNLRLFLFPYLVLTILAQIKTKMNKLTKILAVVVTCLLVIFSGTVTRSAIIDWYPTLVKPVLIPNWILRRYGVRCTL
jgi:hypothetical protein